MTPDFFAEVHHALVHFPIGLSIFAFVLEVAAGLGRFAAEAAGLRAASRWALAGAALAALPVVASGLFLTRGIFLGTGALRRHQLFAWPAYTVLILVAVWQLVEGPDRSRGPRHLRVALLGLPVILIGIAAHFGGHLALQAQ